MQSTMSPLAKLTCPSAEGAEHRGRLFALLDRCMRSPIVWLAGPPGAGKTTLVASYLQVRQMVGIWYQVDAGDADPAAFFHYLGQAIQQAASRKHPPMPALSAEYLSDIAGFARRWFREFYSRLPPRAIVVLDNYQDAGVDSTIHALVEVASVECPSGIHLLIISRDAPAPLFARLQSTERLVCFDKDQLRLTIDEARSITADKYKLSAEIVRKLFEASNGWAAGFTMMSEAASRTGEVGSATPEAETVTVFNYFATQVFEHASPHSRDMLTRIAFVPRLTVALAERVTGSSAAGRLLEHLYQRRLFTDRRVTGDEATYQFHALFRTFLQARAKASNTAEALRDIKWRSASALEQSGQFEDALALYIECQEWASAHRVLLGLSHPLSAQGRDPTLAAWAGQFPSAELEARPQLLYILGIGQAYANPDLGRATLERAAKKFASDASPDMEIASIVAIITVFVHAYSKWERMEPWADRLETLLSDGSRPMASATRDRGLTRLLFARAYCAPDRQAVERLAEQALSILESTTDVNARLDVASQLLNAYCWIGDIPRQEHIVSVAQALTNDNAVRPWLRISWCTHASRYWWVGRADHARASEAISRGLEIAEETGLSALNGYLHGLLFNIRIDEGDLAAASLLAESIEAMQAAGKRYAPAMVLPGRGLLELLRGDSVNARIYALAGLAAAEEWGTSTQRCMATFLLVVVLVAAGEYEEAQTWLDRYESAQLRIAGRMDDYLLHLLKAYLALEQGDARRCDLALGTTLPIGRKQGYVNHIYWYPPMMSRLYARALKVGIEPEFAANVIRRRALRPESADVEIWPWPVKIFTLGHFSILKDDRKIEFGRKTPVRLLLLLKAVLAYGGREVPAARLVDVIWPDLEGDGAAESLQVSLHRLRKLIGEHSISMRNGCVTLNEDQVWVDIWEFERLLAESVAAANDGQVACSITQSRKALAMYRGTFLGNEADLPWASSAKERWRGKYVAHVSELGRRLVATGAVEEALTTYLGALEVEDLAEPIYQDAMRCCLELSRRSEGLLLHRRLRVALSAGLGVAPDAVSEALRRSLTEA